MNHKAPSLPARLLARHPRIVLMTGLLLWAILAAGMARLTMKTDYQVFFGPQAPEVIRFHQFQHRFGQEDTLYFTLESAHDLFRDPRALEVIAELTRRLQALPHVRRVSSLANFPLVDSDRKMINIEPGYEVSGGRLHSDRTLPQLEKRFLEESSIVHRLLSSDGHMAGLLVILKLPAEQRDAAAAESWRAAHQLLQEMKQRHPGLQFRLTGSVALDAAFVEANQRDFQTLYPLALLLILGGGAFLLGSLRLLLVLGLVTVAALLSTLGTAGWIAIPISSVSITAPVIVLIVAVATVIHLFVAWQRASGKGAARLEQALDAVLVPSLLTTLTTMAGLLTLNFGSTPPFAHLGNLAAAGVLLSYLFTLTLAAPLLHGLHATDPAASSLRRWMIVWGRWLEAPAMKRTAWGILALFVVSSVGMLRMELDDNYVHYFDDSFQFRRDADHIDRRLAGLYTLEYGLPAVGGDVWSAAYLQAVRDFALWARQQPGVRAVDSLDDIVARVNKAYNDGDPTHLKVPDDNDRVVQYATLYEMSVTPDYELENRVAPDRSLSRVTLYLSNLSIRQIDALDRKARGWLSRHPYFSGLGDPAAFSATGTSILFSHIGLNNITGMLRGTLLLFAMAALLMWAIFRRPLLATLATLANVVPALVALGLWGWLIGRVGMGSAAVVAITLGLVIDDTIHFGYHYMRARQNGLSNRLAVRETLANVGPALLTTSLVLAAGFAVIGLSSFEINAAMGRMVALTILAAAVFDLLLLPLALMVLDRRNPSGLKALVGCRNDSKAAPLPTEASPAEAMEQRPVRRALPWSLPLLLLVLTLPAAARTWPEDPVAHGLALARETDRRDEGFGDIRVEGELTHIAPGGSRRVRNFRMATVEMHDDGDRRFIRVTAPPPLKGTLFLAHSHALKPDDLWVTLPRSKRLRRISARNKTGRFLSSEFTLEDISPFQVEKFRYRYLRDEPCGPDGRFQCHLVENVPLYAHSGYSRQLEWLDTELFQPRRIDYFNRAGRLTKRLQFQDYRQVGGRYWRPGRMEMTNLESGARSIIQWHDYQVGTGLKPDDLVPGKLHQLK